ncbi:MAG: hypothetical protein K2N47_04550, partial [Clostridia bacterium]|nr:hypothetical protein [Clostridia bacterium]
RRESGLYMHFGQLNQGKLGRCIFNVAVTRAQYMVTIVHSVRANEITGDNVSYIKDYLETVERFNSVGRDQFVCEDAGQGFISSVADFIESKGIPRDRIVTGYGVTDGSVRIPVAILSKDLSRAIMGVWCERETGNKYDYLDYNMRYSRSLEACGWKLHRVSIHDWVDNKQNEQRELETALDKILKSEEKNSNG